jgi:hypothetical protein
VTFGGAPAQSFSGDNSTITAVAPAHVGGSVPVQVTTVGGTSSVAGPAFTYPTAPDTVKPSFTALGVSPTAFRAANLGGPIVATRVGARVSYRLSEAAKTTFTVERAASGRRSGRRCVKPTRANRRRRKCTRYVRLTGSFTHAGAAGLNRFLFSGRLRGKALAPASYHLLGVAVDAARNRSKQASRGFRIVRR